jgi:hypothetical protein
MTSINEGNLERKIIQSPETDLFFKNLDEGYYEKNSSEEMQAELKTALHDDFFSIHSINILAEHDFIFNSKSFKGLLLDHILEVFNSEEQNLITIQFKKQGKIIFPISENIKKGFRILRAIKIAEVEFEQRKKKLFN